MHDLLKDLIVRLGGEQPCTERSNKRSDWLRQLMIEDSHLESVELRQDPMATERSDYSVH